MIYGLDYESQNAGCIEKPEARRCDSCGQKVAALFPCTWDKDLMVGDCCHVHSGDLPEEPVCTVVAEIAESVRSVREFAELLRAHQPMTCVSCEEGRKTVVSDRLVTGSNGPACCEENRRKGVA